MVSRIQFVSMLASLLLVRSSAPVFGYKALTRQELKAAAPPGVIAVPRGYSSLVADRGVPVSPRFWAIFPLDQSHFLDDADGGSKGGVLDEVDVQFKPQLKRDHGGLNFLDYMVGSKNGKKPDSQPSQQR